MTAAEYDRAPRVLTADYDSPAAASLEAIWATKPGLYGWISHRRPQGDRRPLHRDGLRLSHPRRPGSARDPRCSSPDRTRRWSRRSSTTSSFRRMALR